MNQPTQTKTFLTIFGQLFFFYFLLISPTQAQIGEETFSTDEPSALELLRKDFDRTWKHSRQFLKNDLAMVFGQKMSPYMRNSLLQWHLEAFCKEGPNKEVEEIYKFLWEDGARPISISDELICSLQNSQYLITDTILLGHLFEMGLEKDFLIDEGLRQRFPASLLERPEAHSTIQWAIRQRVSVHHPYRVGTLDLTFMPLFQHACRIHSHKLIKWMLEYDRQLAHLSSFRYTGSEFSFFESPASVAIKSFTDNNSQEILETLNLLKNASVDILIEDFKGLSPLDYAQSSGNPAILSFMKKWHEEERQKWQLEDRKKIVELSQNVSGPQLDSLMINTKFGPTPILYYAASLQDSKLVLELIKKGANPIKRVRKNPYSVFWETPLMSAYLSGNEALLMKMISALPNSSKEDQYWLNRALTRIAYFPRINFYDYYQEGYSPSYYGFRPQKLLLKHGAVPDLSLFIYSYCKYGKPAALTFWIEHPDVDITDKYFLEATESAIQHGQTPGDSCAAIMFEHGVDPAHYIDWKGLNLFILACRKWQPLTIRAALEKQPELATNEMWVGRKDNMGYRNPLNEAIKTLPAASFAGQKFEEKYFLEKHLKGWENTVKVLLSFGVDPNRADISGKSPKEQMVKYQYLPKAFFEVFD